MRLLLSLPLLSLLHIAPSLVYADVKITSPAAGASIAVGPMTVRWADSGASPPLSALSTYTLQLVVGGNDDSEQQVVFTWPGTGTFAQGNTAQAVLTPGLGSVITNGYFLKMISVATDGGQVINFSDRFTLAGMTGTTPSPFAAAAQAAGASTNGPPRVNQVANGGAVPPVPAAGTVVGGVPAQAGMPYAEQTAGAVKFAPMQGIPPTKITKKDMEPLFPKSSVQVATAWLPPAQFTSTATASQTFSVQSQVNTASAAEQPTDDMARFLARWKD